MVDFKEKDETKLPVVDIKNESVQKKYRKEYLHSVVLDISSYIKILDNSDRACKLETKKDSRNETEILEKKTPHCKKDIKRDYRENHQVNI